MSQRKLWMLKTGSKLQPETYITKRDATDSAIDGDRAVRVLVKEIPTFKRKATPDKAGT